MSPTAILGLLAIALLVAYFRSQAVRARARQVGATHFRALDAQAVVFPGEIGAVGLRWRREGVVFLLKSGISRCSLHATAPEGVALDALRVDWIPLPEEGSVRVEGLRGTGSDRIRKNLEGIARLSVPASGFLEVRDREIVLRRRRPLLADHELAVFANLASAVVMRLLKARRMEGVEILDAVVNDEEGSCPVCGDGLRGESVRCLKCKAPHHRECWDYVGSCSTFACGGREFLGGPAAEGRPVRAS